MKKLLTIAVVLAALFCISAFAAEPGYMLNPDFDTIIEPNVMYGATLDPKGEYITVIATGDLNEGSNGDPHFVMDGNFDAKYEWIKMRIRNLSDAVQFEFHFASEATEGKIVAESCTHFPITAKDNDFKEYIFNIKEYNSLKQNGAESVWSGNISLVRFDCMWIAEPSGQMPMGSSMDIDYIAFFETEEDAKAYTGPVVKDYASMEWDEASPHFIFDNEEEIAKWEIYEASSELEMGNLKYSPTGPDPTLRRHFETPFSADEFHYFAYRFKADITDMSTIGGMFFTNNIVTSLTGNFYHPFNIIKSGAWANLVFDLKNIKNGTWEGTITSMRLDPLNGKINLEDKIYINRLGFFRTEDEAYAFLADGKGEDFSGTARIEDETFRVIIPGGTIKDTFIESEYTVTGKGSAEAPLVTYVAPDGKESIVAMSYTNDYGYTYYVANKPGTYKFGANHKDYTDIAGHWGESYINFVSDRALFGGTSPTEFSPDQTMTRGMFITVLGRMHGLDTSAYDGNTGYTDVPAAEYYAPYIQWAKETGIMAGVSATEFAPEAPITRAAMAVVIKNYTDKSGFTFTVYKETEGFNDLAGLDEATVNAINTVKNVGIINGKGEGRFDPNGISTRAEVATVMERVIKTVLGVYVPSFAYDSDYFSADRIRLGIWGFPSSLSNEKGMKQLYDLGINSIISTSASANPVSREYILGFSDVYGIEVHMDDYYTAREHTAEAAAKFLSENDPVARAASYMHHPSFVGHGIIDEPGTDSYDGLSMVVSDYQKKLPGKRAFINLLPMYANAAQLKMGAHAASIEYYDADPNLYRKYCEAWFEKFDTDYISTDIYPFTYSGNVKITYNNYIESINQIASTARKYGKEFWCCIQTYGWDATHRTPNEAEFRWQSYCMLSFGCTSIMLWQYFSTNPNYPSLIDNVTLEPTQAYYECQPVMKELGALSDVFVQYKNLGVFTHNATRSYQKMTDEYTGFDTIKEIKSDNALLIGCFEKKDASGAYAFTLVNMEDFQTELSASATISVDPAKTVTVYNRGVPTVYENDGTIELSLACGDGVFVTVE
ncbi:MAG: S-layer homology domain-containing protein [Clostridia bacterium]|nr:S-layer homology domain-containing protein [Clostridia bacterium]